MADLKFADAHSRMSLTANTRCILLQQVCFLPDNTVCINVQDTTILYANLPLLTCIYGALWTPFFLFDATVKAEAFDIGLVRSGSRSRCFVLYNGLQPSL